MPYDVLEKKIKSLPESCFQEVSDYLDTLIIRIETTKEAPFYRDVDDFFGSVSEESGNDMLEALSECRKVDASEW